MNICAFDLQMHKDRTDAESGKVPGPRKPQRGDRVLCDLQCRGYAVKTRFFRSPIGVPVQIRPSTIHKLS